MPQNNLLQDNQDSLDKVATVKGAPVTRLERQKFDISSVRIQMILGLIMVLAVVLVAYQPTLKIGFLLDDFLHVDYVARAFNHDRRDFLANFTGNWAGSDLMKSYRPVVSVSFFLDYIFWHANAFGFHLTNIFLLAGCCLFIALITLELTGRNGNKMMAAPALWAALLFAVYPLHPEAAAWIVGRVDLLSTMFYLASVFNFLRYQQIRENQYIVYSLIAFILAATSKEMAVTLPIVITAAAILLPPTDPPRPGEEKKLYMLSMVARQVWMYWAALMLIAFARLKFLGTLIGGYGQTDIHSLIASLASFTDRASIFKIFVPVSEEMHASNALLELCAGLIVAAVLAGVTKNIICRSSWKPALFLLMWCAVALLPTFQIWHIYPNLVGSRLFFLSSAPFCVLLALIAQPATEAITKRTATILGVVGASILAAIFLLWTYCLELNLAPWVEAGQRMKAIALQLDDLSKQSHGRVALLTLPTDYKGAGMITRPLYLTLLSKPPFHQTDISKSLLSTEASAADHNLAQRLRQLAENRFCYSWSDAEGRFVPWPKSNGVTYLSQGFTAKNKSKFAISPQKVLQASDDTWQVRMSDAPYVEQHADFVRVYPGAVGIPSDQMVRLMPIFAEKLNPLQAEQVVVKCSIHEKDSQTMADQPNKPPHLWVSWQSGTNATETQEFECPLHYLSTDLYIAAVGDSTDWCRLTAVDKLRIKCAPGNYVADIYWIKGGNTPIGKMYTPDTAR